jgi:hypothetical protein
MDIYVPEAVLRQLIVTVALCAALAATAGWLIDLAAGVARSGWWQIDWSRAVGRFLILFGATLPIALTAYVAGYLATMNRVSAIGNVLPAVLALIGGANVYVFGSDTKNRALVGYCTTVLVLMLFYGAQTGAYFREATREERLNELSEMEFRVKNHRLLLELKPEMPAWLVSAEPK